MWKFNGSFLTSPDGMKVWSARSGGIAGHSRNVTYGADGYAQHLPDGPYHILPVRHGGWISQEEMRIPGRNIGWFVPLEPCFQTDRGTPGKGMFGIHPDGGQPGTNGCIGVFSGDYDELFRMLTDRSLSNLLEVKYS